ncbi:glucosylglycerol 3-phosphatase [Lyngbya confervoides]|uniref:Glucosylglycerol 3-phosphatase n=1 Tax=Lyngbya confervoides BDU141951 TaxID=1574623 RepID=A0ABD4T703_9CYAN|nr:glucosylglycerol 3-phosphatase [Lyngbya confervoides]MCM1984229.1 glucosylglycerol 3-phosphatase [Lyngbya confervoides BDU141951]
MSPSTSLPQQRLSLDHEALVHCWGQTENLLIIQDLDGVCMPLVKDPLQRQVDPRYLAAVPQFEAHFFVLTNGEHIGSRGMNRIVERSLARSDLAQAQGLYLPGLAAGGVQWQTRYAQVSHPGVSPEIMAFLDQVPAKIEARLRSFFDQSRSDIAPAQLEACIQAAILDNKVSPTANLNVFHAALGDRLEIYRSLQEQMGDLMADLLQQAANQGLAETFFVHYAPNLGLGSDGNEMMQLADGSTSGTTDFQFMLRGARKEVGVLFLLNQYYAWQTGDYPLGSDFHVLDAPQDPGEILQMIQAHFPGHSMPLMVGVGDTVTSQVHREGDQRQVRRGGSDRGFLQLIQDIGRAYGTGNFTVYVDSSGGEVKNRKPLKLSAAGDAVLEGPTDPQDTQDPLTLNVAIPGGHQQYVQIFQSAAQLRQKHSD